MAGVIEAGGEQRRLVDRRGDNPIHLAG